jgi:hypothetical protein
LGEVVPRWDPQTKIATFQAHGLRPDKYTVILTAKAEGKKLECRWAFTVSPDHDPSARPTTTGVVR